MNEKIIEQTTTETFVYGHSAQLPLKATLYRPEKVRGTLLYFHGGGFLYGHRNDLPAAYRQALLEAGYSLFTFDYPLAPEVPLVDIYQSAQAAIQWFLQDGWHYSGLGKKDYILFGRSAGGYLVSLLSAAFPHVSQIGLIRFYGYQEVLSSTFLAPSAHYQRLPKVAPIEAQQIIEAAPITEGSLADRFPLYLSARQFGNWHTYLGKRAELQLLDQQLQKVNDMPPTFMAHCTDDPDVPFQASTAFAARLDQVETEWLSDAQHDFDRQANPLADACYQKLISWLNRLT